MNTFEPTAPYVQAKHYTWHAPGRIVLFLVAHSMESADKPGTAMGVARWFADLDAPRAPAPAASAHSCCDVTQIVCCVDPKDVAWACGATNTESYSLEMAGRAAWSRDEWLSEANTPMLGLAAAHFSRAALYFGIPLRTLTDDQIAAALRDGKTPALGGVTTHGQVNRVWKAWQHYGLPKPHSDLSHTDPGADFPLDQLVVMALEARAS